MTIVLFGWAMIGMSLSNAMSARPTKKADVLVTGLFLLTGIGILLARCMGE